MRMSAVTGTSTPASRMRTYFMAFPLPPGNLRLYAFGHDRPELHVLVRRHEKWIRLTCFARLKLRQPLGRHVEERVVLHFDVDFHLPGDVEVVVDRLHVLLQSWRRDAIGREDRAAEQPRDVRSPAFFHRKDERDRAR